MTLLTKLEDSEEGLVGITKRGEKVHLGTPLSFSTIHSLRTSDSDTATERLYQEAERFEQMLEADKEEYIYFDKEQSNCVSYHTEDIPLRRWFSDGKFVRNYSVKFTYLQFEKKKEEAFQLQSKIYCPESLFDSNKYVKIHRMKEDKHD